MVITKGNYDLIRDALNEAKGKTSAKIGIAVVQSSTSYHAYVLGFGLILGSLLSFLLWQLKIVQDFPYLLGIQLAFIALCDLTHALSAFFIKMIPPSIRYAHGHHEALRFYHEREAGLAKDQPFVFLFVSLDERYVHILTNPVVHQHLPHDWHKITENFALAAKTSGLGKACGASIHLIAERLSHSFPR